MKTPNFHQIDISNTSFLVTGGAGFIGSNIVGYLLSHKAKLVRVLDNLSTSTGTNIEAFKNLPNFELMIGDISQYDVCLKATEGIDYVSHQAALGSVPRSIDNPVATNQSNITGFLNLITAARENNVRRTVFASSSSVYGDSKNLPKVENEIGNPLSPYAVSKYCNELYAAVANKNYNQELIGLRYFNVFGPNQSPTGAYAAVIPLFIEAVMNHQAPYINGDGMQSRDFTFVENAVQANIKAIFTTNQQAIGEVFNVAVGESYTLNELFKAIKELIGAEINPIHREERAGDVKNSLANISKAKEFLGFQPTVKLNKGLEKTIDWFKTRALEV